MDRFLQGVEMRHACKIFDETKAIPNEQFQNILKVGHQAPSSFGLEPTRLLVIKDKKTREEIKPLCWDQAQITTCSEVIVFKALKVDLLAGSNYVKNSVARKLKSPEKQEICNTFYANYLKNRGYDDYTIGYWSALQSYIVATSMMDYASFLGIDSCMIEGFEKKPLEKYFNLDTEREQITLLLTLGYRKKPQSERLRIDFNEFVKFI